MTDAPHRVPATDDHRAPTSQGGRNQESSGQATADTTQASSRNQENKRPLVFGEVCAGVGGMSRGLIAAGMTPRWFCEWDKDAAGVLALHHPDTPIYCDLNHFYPNEKDHAIDILVGGTSCQNLSVAGDRSGLDGEQSRVFWQMVRIGKRLRARYVLWENVAGALSSNGGLDFAAIVRAWTGCPVEVPEDGWGNAGFVPAAFPCRWNVAWRVFDSQYFGVAQRRRRVFLVGSLGDASCVEILFEPEGVRGDSAPSRDAGERVAPTISARPNGGGGLGTDTELDGGLIPEVVGALADGAHNGGGLNGQDAYSGRIFAVRRLDHSGAGREGAGQLNEGRTPDCHEGDAMSKGPIAFDTTQITSRENRCRPESGDPCHPLAAGAHPPAIAFSCKDHGADAAADLSPTLRAMGHKDSHMNGGGQVAVCFNMQAAGNQTTPGASEDAANTLSRSTQQAVAFVPKGDAYKCSSCAHFGYQDVHGTACPKCGATDAYENVMIRPTIGPDAGKVFDFNAQAFKPSHYTRDKDGAPSDIVPPLSADADKGDQEPLVFQTRIARNGRGQPESIVPSLNGTNAGDTSDMRPVIAGQEYGVRRLTPTECERLQAWPDGWTAKRMKLKRDGNLWVSTGVTENQTDSPRYKQAGNGVTSSVPEWIANRINQFRA